MAPKDELRAMLRGAMTDRTTVVKTYGNLTEAEIARDRLKDAGINAFLRKDDAGGMHPQMQLTQGVKLIVHERDVNEADELLQAFDQPDEPIDERTEDKSPQVYSNMGWALLIIGTVTLFVAYRVPGPSTIVFYTGCLGGALILAGVGCQIVYAGVRRRDKPRASSS